VTRVIELTDVSKSYDQGSQEALSGIFLNIDAGEFVAVMGPSGSGKSTLLNLIAGLDRPTSGGIIVDGVDLGPLNESALARYRRTRLGIVFQFFQLLNDLTVFENVMLPAQLVGANARASRTRAAELLNQLGIDGKAGYFPARLSGGERQRVGIARALINTPALVLADEPTGALDSRSGEQVMELLEGLHRDGQTILLVTHDAKLAARYAERVVSLRDGRAVDDADLRHSAGATAAELLQLRGVGVGQ
jgi:putative ABC transport system ATP-binding protein